MNLFAVIQELGISVVLIVVAFSAVAALLIIFDYRYRVQADNLYELLKKKYPDKLKILGETKQEFPLTNWSSPRWFITSVNPFSMIGITKYGIRDQFKTFEKIMMFDAHNAALQKAVEAARTTLVSGLWVIYGSFGIFIVGLLVYLYW